MNQTDALSLRIYLRGWGCQKPLQSQTLLSFMQEATGGRGVDVVIEMLANVNLQKDLELLAPGGTVAVSWQQT